MKKILFLHSGAELYGADVVMLELIKGLDKKNFKIYVLLPNDGPLVKKLKEENIDAGILNYPILRRKYFNLKGIIEYCVNYHKYSRKIVDFCRRNGIDIVHINTSAVLEGCYIKKKMRIPVIWHIHEILTSPKIVVNFVFKKIARYSDKVICVSKAVEDNFRKITGINKDKISVVYNGIDNKKFNPKNETKYLRKEFGIKENDIVVGMIGRVNAWKGQGDFVDAMEIVFRNSPKKNIKAVLVGGVFEGQEWRMDDLKKKIGNSEHRDRFVLSDFRTDSPNVHNLFDIFVLPSTDPDPLPTVVLESMATKKPVVGYKHGGICEMVEDGGNGLLAQVGNPEDLSRKISELINNDIIRHRYGDRGLERQKNIFSLSKFVKKFEDNYNEMEEI